MRAIATLLALLLAACSSGSGAHLLPSSLSTASVVVRMAIPHKASASRKPAYVSASTQSASYSFAPSSGSPTTIIANLTPSSPGCSVAPPTFSVVCSTSLNLAPGTYAATIVTYDGPNGTGNLLSRATTNAVVHLGQANAINMSLGGVPTSFIGTLPIFEGGQGMQPGLGIFGNDASGNTIFGSDAFVDSNGNPVSITVSLTNEGAFTLACTSCPPGARSVTLSKPNDLSSLSIAHDRSFTGNDTTGALSIIIPRAMR